MKNSLKKDIYWNTIGVTLNSFTSLFFLIIINRINGANIGGVFSFSYSVACLLFIIGVYATRTYQVADIDHKLNDSEYLFHKGITCFIMLTAGVFYSLMMDVSLKKYAILTLTLFKIVEAFSDTLYGFMQKKDNLYLVGISLTIKSILSVLCFFVIDYITNNIIISSIGMVLISLLFTCVFDIYYSKKYITNEKVRFNKLILLFKDGFPIFIISFLSVYIVNASKYTMNGILSDVSQTIFGIIIMPATVISLCGQYIMNPMLNDLVYSFKNKRYNMFKSKVYSIIKILLFFWALAELLAFLFGIPVLNLLYAVDISKYKYDLLLIIFGAVFYASSIIFQNCLIVMHRNKKQIIIYMISSLIALTSSTFFIPKFAIHGATTAYFLTMFIHCIMYFTYFKYEMNIIQKRGN